MSMPEAPTTITVSVHAAWRGNFVGFEHATWLGWCFAQRPSARDPRAPSCSPNVVLPGAPRNREGRKIVTRSRPSASTDDSAAP